MPEKFTPEQIRDYWNHQSQAHGMDPAASWSDIWAIDLEIREITARLGDGDRVLDIGCGNGYSAAQFALQKKINLRGIDYIPALVDLARARAGALSESLAGKLEFAVGDISALNEPPDTYDKVVVVRVIINLSGWELQRKALLDCGRVVKPGGLLLLSEATVQGWNNLNAFRAEWGLPPIPVPSFNTYLDEEKVVEAMGPGFELVELKNFSSTYFVGTRVVKPLILNALDRGAEAAIPEMHWNRWWSALSAAGDYGTQKLFVFKKRLN